MTMNTKKENKIHEIHSMGQDKCHVVRRHSLPIPPSFHSDKCEGQFYMKGRKQKKIEICNKIMQAIKVTRNRQ